MSSAGSTDKLFEGKVSEIESVLGLRFESIKKKKPYKDFIEDVASYASSNIKMGTYLVPFILQGNDPMDEFDKLSKPERLEDDEKKDADKLFEYQQEYKVYLDGKKLIRENKRVLFTIIWGQCSPSLQAVVKGLDDFLTNFSTYNTKWLLEQLKVVSAGIDSKSNVYVQLHLAVLIFFNMKQYPNESNDAYLRRFQSNVDVLELSGGKHLLYSSSSSPKVAYEDAGEPTRMKEKQAFWRCVSFVVPTMVDMGQRSTFWRSGMLMVTTSTPPLSCPLLTHSTAGV
jgi:hypothetical protein